MKDYLSIEDVENMTVDEMRKSLIDMEDQILRLYLQLSQTRIYIYEELEAVKKWKY